MPRKGTVTLGAVVAFTVVGAAAGVALAARVVSTAAVAAAQAPSAPQDFWPTTVVGWVSIIGFVLLLLDRLIGSWRWSQKPLQREIESLRKELTREMDDLRKAVDAVRATCSADLDGFRRAIEKEINGWSRRIEETDIEQRAASKVTDGLVREMIEYRVQREHAEKQLGRIETLVQDIERAQRGERPRP